MINFFIFVVVAFTIATGVIYFLDRFIWVPAREQLAESIQINNVGEKENDIKAITDTPMLIKTNRVLFPALVFVLVVRSFFYEIYNIPTSSMQPNFNIGSSVLINKYIYGVKEPLFHKTILDGKDPQRDDVVVFQLPDNPGVNFIKRVVGLPGDLITYKNKQLTVKSKNSTIFIPESEVKSYQIDIDETKPDRIDSFYLQKDGSKGEWVVPDGNFFVMGDNRDNSQDSRFWGFVPKTNLVGKVSRQW